MFEKCKSCIFYAPRYCDTPEFCRHNHNPGEHCDEQYCPRLVDDSNWPVWVIDVNKPVLYDESTDEWSFILTNGDIKIFRGEELDNETQGTLRDLKTLRDDVNDHSEECQRRTQESMFDYRRWALQWPNHCKKCYGWGGHSYAPTMYRDGSGEPGGYEECICIDDGICPRCGSERVVWLMPVEALFAWSSKITSDYPEGSVPFCVSCGWIDDAYQGYHTPGAPEIWECDCWYENEYDVFDEPWYPEDKIDDDYDCLETF